MSWTSADSQIAAQTAKAMMRSFEGFFTQFKSITRRAKGRFEQRHWHGMQTDAAVRLKVYRRATDMALADIEDIMGSRINELELWSKAKQDYSQLLTDREDWELAETFYNSVTRRVFTTVGVNPLIEFVDTGFETPPILFGDQLYHTHTDDIPIVDLMTRILQDYSFQPTYSSLHQDAELLAERIQQHLREIGAMRTVQRTQVIKSVFYRGKGAYIIGKMFSGSHQIPLVIALLNKDDGIAVDAVLLTENAVSILFSFTRSYFLVDVDRYYDLVRFLKSIMPRKRIAELYIALGHNKHGKTELYRDIIHHFQASDDRFEYAPGVVGMVMIVFTIPGLDVVFKIIRDTFTYPKVTDRQMVLDKYSLVFKHDRAGRLVDAQEFTYLEFDRSLFAEDLLQELLTEAKQTVEIKGENIVIKHAYIERRMMPLDIFAAEAGENAAIAAVVDYGQAIKDLAKTNIFPGDMLLKNFGVTRHGRVVFYDYDELRLLSDCNFRHTPKAPNLEDMDENFDAEAWFKIGENDIFPTEFIHFLGLLGKLRTAFLQNHQEIYRVEYWQWLQQRIDKGEIIHTLPYGQKRRLRPEQPVNVPFVERPENY
ncbi:MAG: bifunctional isocitrate dehydrogenase kinase/phosphatase [Calditrichota bacterium]